MPVKVRMTLAEQPYFLLLVTAILFLIAAFFIVEKSIDIHLHDTYVVVPVSFLMLVLAILLFTTWALYKLTHHFLLSHKLIWVHVVTTLLVMFSFLLLNNWHNVLVTPVKEATFKFEDFVKYKSQLEWIGLVGAILFILAQIAFVVNIAGGYLKHKMR